MRTGTLVAALTMSGVLGGAVGALLVQGTAGTAAPAAAPEPSAGAAPARDPEVEREIASLRARLDEMQSSVTASSSEAARLRGDLEQEKKAGAAVRERLSGLETAGTRPALGRLFATAGEPGAADAPVQYATRIGDLTDRLRRTMDLRQKPEEERWAAAREALGLTLSQEEELKTAIKERDQSMRDAMKVESREVKDADGNGTQAVTISMPDPEKMREARRKYDDRVGSALNQEQAKKWRDDGYEGALGGGMGMGLLSTAVRMDVVSPAEGK